MKYIWLFAKSERKKINPLLALKPSAFMKNWNCKNIQFITKQRIALYETEVIDTYGK